MDSKETITVKIPEGRSSHESDVIGLVEDLVKNKVVVEEGGRSKNTPIASVKDGKSGIVEVTVPKNKIDLARNIIRRRGLEIIEK